MKLYKIFQPSSGHVLGIYTGLTPGEALVSLAHKANCHEDMSTLTVREVARFSVAAQFRIEAADIDPEWDAATVLNGDTTIRALRKRCLDEADPDHFDGWHDYVSAIEDAVTACQ